MMKKLFVIFALAFLLSCAGSSETTSPPKDAPAKSEARKTPEKGEAPAQAPAEAVVIERESPGAHRKTPTLSDIPKAAAHNDNEEYPFFLQFLERFREVRKVYQRDFADRCLIKITNGQQQPLFNIPFRIYNEAGEALWQAVSYTNGENVFFPHLIAANANADNLSIGIDFNGQLVRKPLSRQYQRITEIEIENANPGAALSLDILFILDTTGSMQDEIQQLQDTIVSIHTRIKNAFNFLPIRFGLILYRDRGNAYVVKPFTFTESLEHFQDCLDNVRAEGGGDYPEDLQAALEEALRKTAWNQSAVKLAFIIGDAPPHLDYQQSYTYLDAALEANQRGIKLYTIGASGLQIEGEYIFRQISALTYSEFVFLTYGERGESEGSGVGKVSHHTGDNYESHRLDDLVTNIVKREISYQLPASLITRKEIAPLARKII